MRSAYSTTLLLFLLLLVETSLGRYMPESYFKFRSKSTSTPIDWFPNGNVTIRFDIMNRTSDSYTANVTIFNYMKNRDIVGPWELEWAWMEEEILLNTVGAKGTQHGTEPTRNSVIIADLQPQTEQIVTNCCKGGMITSWYKEADLAKSSSSFQISVGRVNENFYAPSIIDNFTTPGREFICEPTRLEDVTRGYLRTWMAECR